MKICLSAVAILALASASQAGVSIPMSAKVGPVPTISGDGLNGSIYFTTVNDLFWANMATMNPADGTFKAMTVDFPNGSNDVVSGGNLGQFLGSQATGANFDLNRSQFGNVFKFDGYLKVPAPGNYTFGVGSDDGFQLKIANQIVASFDGDRGFATTKGQASFTMAGLYRVELVYWANGGGQSGVEFTSDLTGSDQVVPKGFLYTLPIPAPGSAALMALGGLVAIRRRR